MGSFTDKNNKQWVIDITYGSLKRIKLLAGIDILRDIVPQEANLPEDPMTADIDELPIISRLGFDDELFVNVLFAVCERQATERGVSDVDFGESLRSEHCNAAREVFSDELKDFFQKKPGGKPAVMMIDQMREAIDKFRQAETRVEPAMRQQMVRIAEETDRKINEEIEKMRQESIPPGGTPGSLLQAESA